MLGAAQREEPDAAELERELNGLVAEVDDIRARQQQAQ